MPNPTNKNSLNADGTLTCRMCLADKPTMEFHRNRAISTGFERVCKPCAKEKAALWRTNNKQNRTPNPQARALQQAKRRANKLGARTNLISGFREILFEYYGHACLACGTSEKLEADHVIPLSRKGDDTFENLQPLCKPCNIRKMTSDTDYREGRILTLEIALQMA